MNEEVLEIHYAFPCIVDEWMGGTRFRL